MDDQLHWFMKAHRNTMRRYFQSCGMFNGHPVMLFHLHRSPGMTQRELADEMRVAPATLSVSVRRMEAAGLVSRRTDEHDARVTRLYLTDEGEDMDRRCRQGREFLISTLYQGFSDDEIATLSALMRRMTDNLERSWDTLPEIDDSQE